MYREGRFQQDECGESADADIDIRRYPRMRSPHLGRLLPCFTRRHPYCQMANLELGMDFWNIFWIEGGGRDHRVSERASGCSAQLLLVPG